MTELSPQERAYMEWANTHERTAREAKDVFLAGYEAAEQRVAELERRNVLFNSELSGLIGYCQALKPGTTTESYIEGLRDRIARVAALAGEDDGA